MHAVLLNGRSTELEWKEIPACPPGPGEVRVQITACGVCRTDLHARDGEPSGIKYPIIPGHEIVGRVDLLGEGVTSLAMGERVGIPASGRGEILWRDDRSAARLRFNYAEEASVNSA